MNDLELLRRFEPVVRFTQGELFFPCAVDEYLRRCSLWLRDAKGAERQIVAEGDLSAEKLGRFKEVPAGHTLYLRFVDKPLGAFDYQRWLRRPNRPSFRAPGRLARVGLWTRILDSFFYLSLLVRGKVPGGTAAAADIKYRDMRRQDPRYVYYGRIIREGGYIVLSYHFFSVMNDWRSSFYGVNDHEVDWEKIFIYLSDEEDGEPAPCWVAYAAHEFSGDDLRRRWDDPELHKIDENHPVVYVAVGSHASYFLPGEYLVGIEPEFLRPIRNGIMAIREFWVETLGQGYADKVVEQVGNMLSVPFIDYARGDGLGIGPGQENSWTPILLTEEMDWAEQYRGLWGLDTRDPLGGERAPAGPKYNRDGSVRTAWYDPLGWAGLDKVTPPSEVPVQLEQHIAALAQEREALEREMVQKRDQVRLLALEVQALQHTDYLDKLRQAREEELNSAQDDLQALRARHMELTESWIASRSYLQEIESGNWGDPQAHIHHKHPPEPPVGKQARITELWAAVSGGFLLLAFAALLTFAPSGWLAWTILVGAVFATIEATIRGRLSQFLISVTIVLAIITGFLLVKDFWWLIVIVGLFATVMMSIVANLRELSRK
jgi:hypothetical protein